MDVDLVSWWQARHSSDDEAGCLPSSECDDELTGIESANFAEAQLQHAIDNRIVFQQWRCGPPHPSSILSDRQCRCLERLSSEPEIVYEEVESQLRHWFARKDKDNAALKAWQDSL